MRCFPPLGFGDHSCQLACLLVGMPVNSDWSPWGFLGTAVCFVDLAHASEAVVATAENSMDCCSAVAHLGKQRGDSAGYLLYHG